MRGMGVREGERVRGRERANKRGTDGDLVGKEGKRKRKSTGRMCVCICVCAGDGGGGHGCKESRYGIRAHASLRVDINRQVRGHRLG